MNEFNIEKGILEASRRGFKRAASNTQGVNWDDIDSIKEHELLLMEIRNFPEVQDHVTIQWYLDDDMLPHLDDQPSPIQTNAGVPSELIPEVDGIKEFYAEEMVEPSENMLTIDTFYWLRTYYKNREVPSK